MKKIIPFTKDIKFNTKIHEITSISLENTLSLKSNNVIDGEFIISGDYKINDSSINTEPFIYGLPFDINLDSKYDTNKLIIDIDDFKYEIINEEMLKVNIDVLLDNIEIIEKIEEEKIEPDIIIEARKDKSEEILNDYIDIKDDIKENINMKEEKNLFKEEPKEAIMVSKEEIDNHVTSIFDNFDSKDEKFVSYYVHIVRENDTLNSISTKYKVKVDDIKEYNNCEEITLGNKLIIPFIQNNETI